MGSTKYWNAISLSCSVLKKEIESQAIPFQRHSLAPAVHVAESVRVRMSPSLLLADKILNKKAEGCFRFFPPMNWIWYDLASAGTWFARFLNVLVKGHCLLHTKAVWAWHSWCVPQLKKPGSSRNMMYCSPAPQKQQGVAKLNLCHYLRLFFGLQRQFLLSVCCKYV